MQIGILQCGHAPEEVQAIHGDYDAMFMRLLINRGFEFRTFNVVDMEFPGQPDECDGWLLTGSKHGAYDDLPFIAPLEDFIRECRVAGVPMVGICFGHQIIAQALGGKVEKFSGGWSLGRTTYWMDGANITLNAWHQDQIVVPAPDAKTVATSDFCAHAACVYPGGIYTVQPHPEIPADILADYLDAPDRTATVPKEILDTALRDLPLALDTMDEAKRIADHFFAHAHESVAGE